VSSCDWLMRSRRRFVFNVEASLQAASATCCHATGRCVRGVLSSDFWQFFECGGFLWGFYTEFGEFLSYLQSESFLQASEFSLCFPVSFSVLSFSFSFSSSPLWVYFGQSGVLESVIQVFFRRGF
jgi:hypothetical protein